jgi:hypothetical protein
MRSEPSRFSETEKYISEPLASGNAFVKCRCYIYMDETFTLQLARASDI